MCINMTKSDTRGDRGFPAYSTQYMQNMVFAREELPDYQSTGKSPG